MTRIAKITETLGKKAAPSHKDVVYYNIANHKVNDEGIRPRKKVIKPSGKKDDQGKDVMTESYEDVNRIALPLQRIIVNRRVAFMNVGKMQVFAEPKDVGEEKAFAIINKIRDDNRVAFRESTIAELLNKELQVAKLWYSTEAEEGYWGDLSRAKHKFKMQVLAPSLGDGLFPVFDSKGDLIYFGRTYEVEEDVSKLLESPNWDGEVKKIKRFDIYSKDLIYRFVKSDDAGVVSYEGNNGWVLDGNPIANPYGKIPVVYYAKKKPIWSEVQPLIDRIETVLSNFADTNDYHSSPTLVFLGSKVTGKFMDKGEQGKAVSLTGDKADAKYVTWDQSVSAIELEINTLIDFIFSLTQTPNISFDEMKQLGALSGVAFDRVFIDAHLAARHEVDGEYGEYLQRDLHLMKALVASLGPREKDSVSGLGLTFEIPNFKLDDIESDVDLAVKALEGGLISGETATRLSNLVTDAQEERGRIERENHAEDDGDKNDKK